MPQARHWLLAVLIVSTNLGAFLAGRANPAREPPAKNLITARFNNDRPDDNPGQWDWSDDDSDTCSCDGDNSRKLHKKQLVKTGADAAAPSTCPQTAQLLQQSTLEMEAMRRHINALELMAATPKVEAVELADAGTADEATEIRIPVSAICGDDTKLAETQRSDCKMARYANSPYLYYYLDNSDAHQQDELKAPEEGTPDAST